MTQRCTVFRAPVLPLVEEMKILGVVINNKLNWASHVEHITLVTSRKLHILRRAKTIISQKELHLLYTALIRSILDYASPALISQQKTRNKAQSNRQQRSEIYLQHSFRRWVES